MREMKWLILLCLCYSPFCFSQSLQIEHYGANPSMELSELWKLQIVGATVNDLQNIWLKAEVKQGGRMVYEATTETLPLSRGLNVVDQFKVQIASQHFNQMELEAYVTSTGRLPTGQYSACVRVFQEQVELKTLCIEIRSDNYSPPMLIYPFNGQELSNTTPVLSWLAPVPNAIDGIKYSIKLVEQFEGQTVQEALMRNLSRMQVGDLSLTSMPYPSDALPLEVDKTYAWQVEAFVGSTNIGRTEVWSFKVVELSPEIKALISKQDYIELLTGGTRGPVSVIKKLKFQMSEEETKGEVRVDVYDVSGKRMTRRAVKFKNAYGVNYHQFNLQKIKGLKHEHQYLVIFTSASGEKIDELSIFYLDADKL